MSERERERERERVSERQRHRKDGAKRRTDTHTHTHTLSLSLSHTHTHTLTQIHTHTNSHTNSHTHTHTHTHTSTQDDPSGKQFKGYIRVTMDLRRPIRVASSDVFFTLHGNAEVKSEIALYSLHWLTHTHIHILKHISFRFNSHSI